MKNASFIFSQFRTTLALFAVLLLCFSAHGQESYLPGIAQPGAYYMKLTEKSVAVIANATSLLPNGTHTVDHLISLSVDVRQVWAPEHGFRGQQDAGEHVEDGRDPKTGIPIKSLYGKTKRPPTEWLEGLDWVIYDIQDVGVRFYTYSTTLSYVIDACVEAGVPLMIMDRGNPNGHYIDGPILKPGFESMVGLHPIPVVHGLTMGEYASMVYGEHWMAATENEEWCTAFEKKGGIEVIWCKGYSHNQVFKEFQVPPSPNLRSIEAIWHYPSLCYFEGTPISCGRGTDAPFTLFGAPWFSGHFYDAGFTPKPDHGAKHPKYEGQLCIGQFLPTDMDTAYEAINWNYLFYAYAYWKENATSEAPEFFNAFFEKLAGSKELQQALESGMRVEEWVNSYYGELNQYKQKAYEYALYPHLGVETYKSN
ncbi:DUF1343 domain-containing protein [Schleiferiaceae bacterium]|nr:DUF1343 domain-containing protein [Schleiferiaceae bacterium]MDC1493305.1 DUF1343 domain-containing protein [Schleiferiaceae bacterium]